MSVKDVVTDEVKDKIIEVRTRIKESNTDAILKKALSTVDTVDGLNQLNGTKSKQVISVGTGSIRVLVLAILSIRQLLGK